MATTTRTPPVGRLDDMRRPISLSSRWTDRSAVLYTGAPGLGVSAQLDDIGRAAERAGALVLRIKASKIEPIEHRFAREVRYRLGSWLGTFDRSSSYWRGRLDWRGFRLTQRLKRRARELNRSVEDKGRLRGIRSPSGPMGLLPQGEIDTAAPRLQPPATLNDLADAARDVARHQGRGPAMIVIDDVHRASPRDLAAINELAEHLEATNREGGQHVVLVMGGREDALDVLREASKGANGAANETGRLYDTRPCLPFTTAELAQVLAQRLDQVVQPQYRNLYCHPVFQQAMIDAAHGNAGRLTEIVDNAIAETGYGRFQIDAGIADRAVRLVDADRERTYTSIWNGSSPVERQLMMMVAQEGDRGLDIAVLAGRTPDAVGAWSPDELARWSAWDSARQSLDMQHGVMDVTPDGRRLVYSDPGMRDFVVRHNAGLLQPHQPAPGQQYTGHQQPPGYDAHAQQGGHAEPAAYRPSPYQQHPWQPGQPPMQAPPYQVPAHLVPGHPDSGHAAPGRPTGVAGAVPPGTPPGQEQTARVVPISGAGNGPRHRATGPDDRGRTGG